MNEAGIRTALGLATANLDTQLSTIDTVVDGIAANYATSASATAINDLLDDMVDGTVTLATIDTVVDAIKVKTDSLTFTVANKVDSNVTTVNSVTVTGTGTTADPWNP